MSAEQLVRVVLVVLALALPVLVAWVVGRSRAARHAQPEAGKVRRRWLTGGVAVSAGLAMLWVGGVFVDERQQRYDNFFVGVMQGCTRECAGAGIAEADCAAYCTCYRDTLQALLTEDEVVGIVGRLEESQGSGDAVRAVQADFEPAITAAAEQCLGLLPPEE